MSAKPSESRRLAVAVSRLLYGIAGWMMVGFGVLGIAVTVFRLFGNSAAVLPGELVASAAIVLLSIVFVLLGLFVNPRFRDRLDRRHSLTRFGRVQSVDERVLHSEEGQTERCVDCGTRLNEGLVRRYRDEVCFAGIPVYTASEDHNHYCVECAATELGVAVRSDRARTESESGTESDARIATERR